MIQHYIKIAFRHLLKYKMQNLISITGLAVGLFSFSICLYCSRFVENIDHSYPNYKQLAEIHLYEGNEMFAGVSANLAEELRKISLPEVEGIACVVYPDKREYSIAVNDQKELPYALNTMEVDSLYNKLFTPDVLLGSWEAAVQSPNAVVLTQSTAQRVFGAGINPVGKQMILAQSLDSSPQSTPASGGIVYTIRAVIKDLPENISTSFLKKVDILTLNDTEGLLNSSWKTSMTGAYAYALLRQDKHCSDLQSRINAMHYTFELFRKKYTVVIAPIGEKYRKESVASYFSLITGIIGLLILLSGLLNFFHFQTGAFLNRTREYSIRKVEGGGAKQLFALLFMQMMLVLFLAVLLMFCSIELLSPFLQLSLFEFNLVINTPTLMNQVWQYTAALIVLCAFICALTARRMHCISVQDGIRGTQKRQGKHWVRNTMLGIQFFICWIFITFTLALFLQSEKTSNTLFGTLTSSEKESIFSIPLDYAFMSNENKLDMVNRIRQHSGVKEILLSDGSYTQGVSNTRLSTEKGNSDSSIEVNVMAVSSHFFSFMNIPIVKGESPKTGQQMVVDQVFADKQQNVMGTTYFNYSDNGYTVCGISKPFYADVYGQSPGFIFRPTAVEKYVGHCYVKTTPDHEAEVKAWIEKIQKEVLPENISAPVHTFLEDIRKAQALENGLKGIILFFSVVSALITLLGVYSAITLDTVRRQKEVAIRKVNGAGAKQIILLFSRLYFILLTLTALIAFPLCGTVLMMWKQMYTVFFNHGIFFWITIFLLITLITAFTILFRILQIARINPAEIIKNE